MTDVGTGAIFSTVVLREGRWAYGEQAVARWLGNLGGHPLVLQCDYRLLLVALYGYLDLVVVIVGTADDSIGTMTNLFNVFKFILNAEGSA